MSKRSKQINQAEKESNSFDLFKLGRSSRIVGISPNTIRTYFLDGLSHYKCGGSVFVSKSELAEFIKSSAA